MGQSIRDVRIAVCFLFFLLFFCTAVQAVNTPPPGEKPILVKVGLYLDDILFVDEKTESMSFTATLTLKWKDTRLRPGSFTTLAAQKQLAQMWHPQINVMGARDPRRVRMMHLSIDEEGLVTWVEKLKSNNEVSLDLRNFPFDSQVLKIGLRPFLEDASKVKLVIDPAASGVSGWAQIDGWKRLSSNVRVSETLNFLYHKPFYQYVLSLRYKRVAKYYLYQLFIPILLIALLSFSVFWMLKNPLVNRVAISLTSVLTIVVFQWRILGKMPRINYHTLADMFMLTSFVVAASTVIASICLDQISSDSRRIQWANILKIVYPALYLLSLLFLGVGFLYF